MYSGICDMELSEVISEDLISFNTTIEAIGNNGDKKALIEKVKESIAALVQEYSKYEFANCEYNNLPHHLTELSAEEVLSEDLIVRIGALVNTLSVLLGSPTPHELANAVSDYDYAAEALFTAQTSLKDEINKLLNVKTIGTGEDRFVILPNGSTLLEETFHKKECIRRTGIAIELESKMRKEGFADFDGSEADPVLTVMMKDLDLITPHKDEVEKYQRILNGMLKSRAMYYRDALELVGVVFSTKETMKIRFASQDMNVNKFYEAGTYYPQAWMDNSNSLGYGLVAMNSKENRASYVPTRELILVNPKEVSLPTIVHELGHRMEHSNPKITEMQRWFLSRRVGLNAYYGGIKENKPELMRIPGLKSDEVAYNGDFVHHYVGKVYDEQRADGSGHYEVLTTGMEMIFGGRFGGGIGVYGYKEDIDHTHFVLGLLVTAITK